MAKQIISYQCEHCKHIQKIDFSTCPACGVETSTGYAVPSKWPRKVYRFTSPTTGPDLIPDQPCVLEQAIKKYRDRGEPVPPLGISCPCPKCSPRC